MNIISELKISNLFLTKHHLMLDSQALFTFVYSIISLRNILVQLKPNKIIIIQIVCKLLLAKFITSDNMLNLKDHLDNLEGGR